MSKERTIDTLIKGFARHPYLWAALFCMLTDAMFLGSMGNMPNNVLLLEGIAVFVFACGYGVIKHRKGELQKSESLLLILCVFILVIIGARQYSKSEHCDLWQFFGGCGALLVLYLLTGTKKYKEQKLSLLIIAMGFMLKVHYILVSSVYTRQHDVYRFDGSSGHAAYIDYFLNNHHIPDFDPRNIWQFVHPPLHHIICALWIYVSENIFMVGHNEARESLQTLTLFYTMCIVISGYKILKLLGLKGKAVNIPLLIISFHPAFILFSGSINNDCLSTAFVMGAVVSTIKWQKEPNFKNILKIALGIGLAMSTKVATATIAPPVAIVFLIVFIMKFKEKGKALFGQFCAFGAVCLPLGLWWGIRNYVKYKIPLTYVSKMREDCAQYIGATPFTQRLTDFSGLDPIYVQFADFDENDVLYGINDKNPIVTMFKNSCFGEELRTEQFFWGWTDAAAKVLFWVNIALAAAAFGYMIWTLFKRPSIEKGFVAGYHLTLLASFIKTCADYPFVCTQNFRYITPTAVLGAVFLGLALGENNSGKNTTFEKVKEVSLGTGAVLFAITSMLVYISLKY